MAIFIFPLHLSVPRLPPFVGHHQLYWIRAYTNDLLFNFITCIKIPSPNESTLASCPGLQPPLLSSFPDIGSCLPSRFHLWTASMLSYQLLVRPHPTPSLCSQHPKPCFLLTLHGSLNSKAEQMKVLFAFPWRTRSPDFQLPQEVRTSIHVSPF